MTMAADCWAIEKQDLMRCARCGLQWTMGGKAPPCNPITFERLRQRILGECVAAGVSLDVMMDLTAHGALATDGGAAAYKRLVELEATARVLDRIAGDPSIKQRLNEKQ